MVKRVCCVAPQSKYYGAGTTLMLRSGFPPTEPPGAAPPAHPNPRPLGSTFWGHNESITARLFLPPLPVNAHRSGVWTPSGALATSTAPKGRPEWRTSGRSSGAL